MTRRSHVQYLQPGAMYLYSPNCNVPITVSFDREEGSFYGMIREVYRPLDVSLGVTSGRSRKLLYSYGFNNRSARRGGRNVVAEYAAAGRPRSRSCCDSARACRSKQVLDCPAATCRTRTLSRTCAEPFCPLRLLIGPATMPLTSIRLPA
eukprot:scaffold41210_cov66-Phaeocystis_antarctica.AAC.5